MSENNGSNSEARIIASFERDLVNRGLKPHTRLNAMSCVSEYLERLRVLELDIFQVRPADLIDYQLYLESRPNHRRGGHLSPRTVQIHLNAIRALYAFLERCGLITTNPASCLRLPAVESPDRSALTLEDIERLRSAASGPLDRGILAVLYGCGLRRSEALALNVTDVDLHGALLHVRSGKGGRPRSVPMSDGVVRDLSPLVRMLRPHGQTALFIARRGGRLGGSGMYARVKRMAVRAQLINEVTLHGLRHAVATHLLQRGLTLEQTRDFLGHREIGATTIYTHVQPAEPEV